MVEVEVIACKKHRRKLLVGWITIEEEGPEKQLVAFCPTKGMRPNDCHSGNASFVERRMEVLH